MIVYIFLFCILNAASSPSQIHIAFAGKTEKGFPSGVSVMWWTLDKTDTNVFYGTSLSFSEHETGSCVNYIKDHGYHHSVVIKGLAPDTLYYYQVGSLNGTRSSTYSFMSPSNSREKDFSVAIFGDMGWLDANERPSLVDCCGLKSNWSASFSRQVLEDWKNDKSIDFVWHLGDIGYADDAFGKESADAVKFLYEEVYNGYMDWVQNLTSTLPYMVAVGNHESECHSPNCIVNFFHGEALKNFTAYINRWRMPSEESGGNTNMWYSFDVGNVHFISVNTETNFPGAGEEHKGDSGIFEAGGFWGDYLGWLENDLKAASEDPDVKWIFAGGHRPWRDLNTTAVPLFDKYGLDVYFSGHVHAYYRSFPVVGNSLDSTQDKNHYVNPNGTVYIVSGGPGNDEQGFNDVLPEQPNVPGSNVITSPKYTMGKLDVSGNKLQWTLLDTVTREVVDNLIITKTD